MAQLHHVIVGASAAGVSAAVAMRVNGFTGRVTLVDSSRHLPYERPPLSKTVGGELHPIVPEAMYAEHGIDLVLGPAVTALDPAARLLELSDGSRLTADAVVLATGVSPRTLDVAGAQLDGICTLRTADDAARIEARLAAGGPLVLVGGGFIGLEAASSARRRGIEVTVVEVAPVPLGPVLGAQVGGLVQRLHEDRGVTFRLGTSVQAFRGTGDVDCVELEDGTRLPAGTVIVGCGVVPNDGLARRAGIECDAGIVVDSFGRTSDPWVWAAGDVTSMRNPYVFGRQRIEHWDVAMRHGTSVGATIAGNPTEYTEVPYFWSEQHGHRLQMFGRAGGGDEVVLRGPVTPELFLACYVRDGRLIATAGMDAAKEVRAAKTLIELGSEVSVDELQDVTIPLRTLATSSGR